MATSSLPHPGKIDPVIARRLYAQYGGTFERKRVGSTSWDLTFTCNIDGENHSLTFTGLYPKEVDRMKDLIIASG